MSRANLPPERYKVIETTTASGIALYEQSFQQFTKRVKEASSALGRSLCQAAIQKQRSSALFASTE
jgi:hypothetical protein